MKKQTWKTDATCAVLAVACVAGWLVGFAILIAPRCPASVPTIKLGNVLLAGCQ